MTMSACSGAGRITTIKRVTGDIDPRMHLNTAISAMMELVNELYAFCDRRGIRPMGRDDEPPATIGRPETAAVLREAVSRSSWCSRLSRRTCARNCGNGSATAAGLVAAGWPGYDEAAAREDEIEIPVQVNGKVRGRVDRRRRARVRRRSKPRP